MPYLVGLQEPARLASQRAPFPLFTQAQWLLESKRVPAGEANWSSLTVALREPSEAVQIWQEMGTSTVRVSQTEIGLLERLYTFREREEVLWFLERYPFLVPLLLEAYYEIEKYFPHSQVFLEVVTDPEAIDDYQLIAFIATNFGPDEAVDRLEQFDEDWWLDALNRAQGKLCIDVEAKDISEEMIVAGMIKHDFIVQMSPIREYSLRVRVKSMEKATPHIVEPEGV